MDGLKERRFSDQLAGVTAFFFNEYLGDGADERSIENHPLVIEQPLKPREAFAYRLGLDLLRHFRSARAWARRIHKGKGACEIHFAHQSKRIFEILFCFARKADDEVGRERDIRPHPPDFFNEFHVIAPTMAAIHRRQDSVRA